MRRASLRPARTEGRAGAPPLAGDSGIERHPEQRTVTIAQLDGLADAVDGRYRALVLCAGLGGIREGELSALRRSDVDLEGGLIRVRRKRLRLASGQVIEDQPKSRVRESTAEPYPARGARVGHDGLPAAPRPAPRTARKAL